MSASDPRLLVLAEMRKQTALLERILAAVSGDAPTSAPSNAPTVDLDSQYGNPKLRFLPRDWTGGQEFKGMLFSECPAALLDLAAESLDYFASKQEDPKKKHYDTLDAARARGWAARIRDGYQAPADMPPQDTEPRW